MVWNVRFVSHVRDTTVQGALMRRRFGKIQKLPSGSFRASLIGPDGARVFAPMTLPSEGDADTWLATQRTDLIRVSLRAGRRRADLQLHLGRRIASPSA